MNDFPITDQWTEDLLTLSTITEQVEALQSANLADETGVDQILDYTEKVVRHEPNQAQALTQLCEEAARQINASRLIPRAIYLRAQTHLLSGEPTITLALIKQARDSFSQLNMPIDALRTDIGLMNTQLMMGDYSLAVETGNSALTQVEQALKETQQNDEQTQKLQWMQATLYVTMGPALSESGHFEEALVAYEQAEALYKKVQAVDDLALVLSNRGVALRYLGRVHEALETYEEAAKLLPHSGYFYALIQTNIGDAQLLLGDYQACLRAYAAAKEEFAGDGIEADQHICTAHIADTYLALNLYPEALALYQEVVHSLQGTDFHYYRGKALWGLGVAQIASGTAVAAMDTLNQAAALFLQLENRPLQISVLLEQAAFHADRGDKESAFLVMTEIFSMLNAPDSEPWPVQQIYAHMRMADLLLPNAGEAESHLSQVDSRLKGLSLPHLRYRQLQRLGHVRRLQKRDDEAQELLEAAIEQIEQLRSSLATEAFRISFQQDKMDAYEELAQLYLQQVESEADAKQAVERVFDLVERAKSRALVDRISGVVDAYLTTSITTDITTSAERESGNNEDKRAVARLQQLQAQLNAIYTDLLGQESGDSDEPEARGDRVVRMAHLNQQATLLEDELTKVRMQASTQAHIGQATSQRRSMQQIQQQLADDTTILSYHIFGDEIVAFVITREKVQVVRRISTPAKIQPILAKISSQWGQFRGQSFLTERHLPRLEQNAQRYLHQLYQELYAPLEPLLSAAGSTTTGPTTTGSLTLGSVNRAKHLTPNLIVVPHGLLHQIPFQALYDGTDYLIDRLTISYAPSVTIFALCQAQQPRQSGNLLAMAVSDPAIPAVEAETKAISQAMPSATILLNAAATKETLVARCAESRVLHFACHGIYREDNPMFSALKLHDGWVTATDLSQLDLTGATMVLSACESGRGVTLAGDEVMGLARGCLSAGASGLVASQWLVQDDTSAMLMAEWYARLARGQDTAKALRSAQCSIKKSHPHPYYWAPFVLMGSRNKIF